jgi:tetratricopeptide (TPR) repeat protein
MAAAGLAVAATLVVAVMLGRNYQSQPSSTLVVALNELDAASGPYRAYEPRFTVLPTHRPLAAPTRSVRPTVEITPALREASAIVEKAAAGTTHEKQALAAAYLAQGQDTRAVEVLAPLAPSANEAGLLNDIAAAYLSRGSEGDAKQALELLERAVSLEPNRAEAWFNLGLAAEKAGQPTRAAEAWKKYLELDSSSKWAAEVRIHLETLKR